MAPLLFAQTYILDDGNENKGGNRDPTPPLSMSLRVNHSSVYVRLSRHPLDNSSTCWSEGGNSTICHQEEVCCFSLDVSFISIHLGVCMFVSFFVLIAHFQLCPTDEGYRDSVIVSPGAPLCFSAARYVEFERCRCSAVPRNPSCWDTEQSVVIAVLR